MSDTEPLLPKVNGPPHDHPIFLRVCHSPWPFLGQKSLMVVRGLLAVYMTTVLALDLTFEIAYAGRGRLFPFFVGNVSYVIQIIYYWISFTWAIQHFLMPHSPMLEETLDVPSFWSRVTAPFRIPRMTSPEAKNQIVFSIFYTAAVTLPFVVTIVFWLILVPTASAFDHGGLRSSTSLYPQLTRPRSPVQGGAEGNPLGDGALKAFVLININAINTIVALVEILVLSSVRRQKVLRLSLQSSLRLQMSQRLNAHMVGLLVFCIIYFLWTGVGRLATGKYVYKYLDPTYKGWRAVVVAIINMMAMTVTMFLVQRGLHGLREDMTKKSEPRLHVELLS